ncbi:signal peptidase I [Desulfocurvibacter africanus PCS]|uniref:Signal peptidase I n=1 Tax=Desulfocurvibacter africanus PCS TaxID=1262666 RepID=M5PVT3_DESAF|nr:signal peptidase I [Desulfocurvibacter africanus]EMG38442.1 signal peptidase I [Desulfocurvibacter africanus PCS]
MNPRAKVFKEYVEALIIALILAFFIRTFVVQAFKIPSGSMLDTLLIGDHLLVNKFKYGVRLPFTDMTVLPLADPKFQDIIVFEYPQDPSKDFIKRVIGLPGDTIEIRDKAVYRNGQKIDEPYVQHTDPRSLPGPRDNMPEITVPSGKYFVMGDNRDESLDSRFWGTVDRSAILGKAWIIYWSWGGMSDIRWGRMGSGVN